MNRRIVILTGNHLCHNPRVVKEATSLANAGYKVTVLGASISPELQKRDTEMQRSLPFEFKPVVDATQDGGRWLGARMAKKAGSLTHRVTGIENKYQLGYSLTALSRAAFQEPADLWITHSEAAMAVAADLARKGLPIGIDMEDWFSEDFIQSARRRQPVDLLGRLEGHLLTKCAHSSCPSKAMSEALASKWDCPPPAVIYNAFPWSDRLSLDGRKLDRMEPALRSIHWFSQTLGPGRGIEDLLSALPLLKYDVEIHLRGKRSNQFALWLEARTPKPWQKRILFHPPAPSTELLSRIVEHDIGLAGESPLSRSRDLTVSNKILHYLLGGLAVVASDTAGQREVAQEAPDAVSLYPSGDGAALAACLNRLLGSADALRSAKAAALDAAKSKFCWERQEKTLLHSVSRAFEC
jgi:glycosyltransferase involved in cell wall biosynthesis